MAAAPTEPATPKSDDGQHPAVAAALSVPLQCQEALSALKTLVPPFRTTGGPLNPANVMAYWSTYAEGDFIDLQSHITATRFGFPARGLLERNHTFVAKPYRILLKFGPNYLCLAASDDWDLICKEMSLLEEALHPVFTRAQEISKGMPTLERTFVFEFLVVQEIASMLAARLIEAGVPFSHPEVEQVLNGKDFMAMQRLETKIEASVPGMLDMLYSPDNDAEYVRDLRARIDLDHLCMLALRGKRMFAMFGIFNVVSDSKSKEDDEERPARSSSSARPVTPPAAPAASVPPPPPFVPGPVPPPPPVSEAPLASKRLPTDPDLVKPIPSSGQKTKPKPSGQMGLDGVLLAALKRRRESLEGKQDG